MKKKILLMVMIVSGVFIMLSSCSQFGTRPKGEDLEKISKSSHYDKNKKKFVNRRSKVIEEMKKKSMTFSLLKEWLSKGIDRTPTEKLPEVKPLLSEFLKESEEIKVIWLGHSSFILNLSGKIILVDPVFSGSAAPVSFMVKRFQKPVLSLEELPEIDVILISHDHYDHLDMESIKFFKDRETKFITPLGVGSHIVGWGVDRSRITEHDWWQSSEYNGITFTATPAQHFSGRDAIHDNETLWASWVIKSDKHNIYFSGDSGYDTHFKDIGEKYGPFDIAFIENGQYNERWKEVHMLPEESAQAYFDLKAKSYFPVHWGMFELSLHSWYEPIEKISEEAEKRGIKLIIPKFGEIVSINDNINLSKWWKTFVKKASN